MNSQLPLDILSIIFDKCLTEDMSFGEIVRTIGNVLNAQCIPVSALNTNKYLWNIIVSKLRLAASLTPPPPSMISRFNGLLEVRYSKIHAFRACWEKYRIVYGCFFVVHFFDNNDNHFPLNEDNIIYPALGRYLLIRDYSKPLRILILKDNPQNIVACHNEYHLSNFDEYKKIALIDTNKGIRVLTTGMEEESIFKINEETGNLDLEFYYCRHNSSMGYYGIYKVAKNKLFCELGIDDVPINLIIAKPESYSIKVTGYKGVDIIDHEDMIYIYHIPSNSILWFFDKTRFSLFEDFIYTADWIRDVKTGKVLFIARDYEKTNQESTGIRGITKKNDNSGYFVWFDMNSLKNDVKDLITERHHSKQKVNVDETYAMLNGFFD